MMNVFSTMALVLVGFVLSCVAAYVLTFLVTSAVRSAWYGDAKPIPPSQAIWMSEQFKRQKDPH